MKSLTTLCLCLALTLPVAAQSPKIGGKNAIFDFGQVVKGAKVTHTYVIKNQGEAPLNITAVTNPCDCFTATFNSPIAPGGEGQIRVTLDTTKEEGPVLLTGVIHSDDPERPTTQLVIKGLVKGAIALLPQDHFALSTVHGESKVHHLVLEINRPRPLKIKGIESTSPLFSAHAETITAGKKYRIVIRASGNSEVGLHSGTIKIKTDDPEKPVIAVDGSVLILSTVAVDPGTLFLQRMSPEEAMRGAKRDKWKVVVKNVRSRPFSVVDVTSDAPYLGATYRPLKNGNYELQVEVKPNTILKQGRYFADLMVKTNLPDGQNVKVPVYLEIR